MVIFFKRSRAANSALQGWTWLNFELIRDLMVVLITCKNEEDRIKNVGATVFTTLNSHFSNALKAGNSAVHGPMSLIFEIIRDLMDVLVTCKNEEDPIRNEGAGVLTTSLLL